MDPFKESKIKEVNARYFGMSELKMVNNAGKALAQRVKELIKSEASKKPSFKKTSDSDYIISIICGLGNNGADGISCVLELLKTQGSRLKVQCYIVGRSQDFKTPEIAIKFKELKKYKKTGKNKASLSIFTDSFAKDIKEGDLIVESLLGSGIKGSLRKRFSDITSKIKRSRSYKIAIDSPAPGYKPNKTLSLITAKQKSAEILDIGLPKEINTFVGPGLIRFLYEPGKDSYKRKTGELLLFGGSELFHGAPIMALKAASKFIGGVFFYTTPENRELINKSKITLQEFIACKDAELEKFANYSNVILAGPGLEDNLVNKALLTHLLNQYPDKTFVLDAYAIAMVNPKQNRQNKRGFGNCILTPHRGELRHIFSDNKLQGLEGKLKRFCIENKCHLVLKGSTDVLFNTLGEVRFNKTGNPGMAKGGTGDILSGMIAALACKNDPWEALQAGTFLSGLAGDLAKEKFGLNFSATDIVPFLQGAYKWAREY